MGDDSDDSASAMSIEYVADMQDMSDDVAESDNDIVPPPGGERMRAVRGGGDAFRQALPRSYMYDHNWLMEFNQPHGQMIFDGDDDTEPTEYGIFSHYFDGEVLNLVTETNRYMYMYMYMYAATTLANKGGMDGLSAHSRLRKWKDVDVAEMKAFLAILLLMGVDRRPSYDMYWTTEWTIQAPGIKFIMFRDCFYGILQMLHCTDNAQLTQAGDPNHDRRGKIKEIMDLFIRNWKSRYYPDREIAIDETIIPFKGRTGMKVYKPNKPHKWGLNCWNVAESCTGYVWNAELDQGKRNNQTEVGMYNVQSIGYSYVPAII